MSSLPIITVTGATGSQGGSVLKYLSNSGKFRVRAVTRKLSDDKAKKLAALPNVEVVEADMFNKASLVKAFSGSWGLFAMTQFWEPDVLKSEGKLEIEAGRNTVEAAKEAKIAFAVVSVLDDAEKVSGNRLHVVHYTHKARIGELWRASGIQCTLVNYGCYLQNLDSFPFFKPTINADGSAEFVSCVRSDVGVPWLDIEDSGQVAQTLFENPKEWQGKIVDIAADYYTYPQLAAIWSRVHGKPCRYVQLTYAEGKGKYMDEILDMFQFFNEYGYFLGRDITETQKRWPMKDANAYFRSKLPQSGALSAELAELKAVVDGKLGASGTAAAEGIVKDLEARHIASHSKKVGDKAPLFELPNQANKAVKLADVLGSHAAVIVFYRGPWCPFCTTTLKAHQKFLSEYTRLGAKFIAMSPSLPSASESFAAANELKFDVLSDVGSKVASSFGVAYKISDANVKFLTGLGVNLKGVYGVEQAELPLGATFVVDKRGVVQFAHVTTDWRLRADPNDIVAALRRLN